MNYLRVNMFCMILMLLMATTALAEPLTLKSCLDQALANNPALKTAAWDVRTAAESVRQAHAGHYPRIDAQAGYTMQLDPQAVIISGRVAETQEPDYAFAGLSATYTLYDFGRRDARLHQAQLANTASTYILATRKSDIALQVIEAYFRLLETGKLIIATEEEVNQMEQHKRVAQALFDEGVVTRNDVLQADVRLASVRQKLLTIRNHRENVWLQLNFLTGRDASYRADLDESTTVSTDNSPASGEFEAVTQRSELQALQRGLDISEAAVRESHSSFYPELYTRLALDYVQNDKVREQAIMSATLGIKFNIFDGFTSTSAREKAVLAHAKNQDSIRQTQAQFQLEISMAKNDMSVAQERIAVAETSIRQSEENLRINRERYQERVGTATEVLDAQTMLTQTKTDYFKALYEYQTASARYQRAIGVL